MKKVLVTGGTIFVRRYIAEYYVAKGYEVYAFCRNFRKFLFQKMNSVIFPYRLWKRSKIS